MAQDYSTYKTYFLASVWRTNDTVIINNLNEIIREAEQELDKRTRDWDRRQITAEIAPETEDFDLTTNVSDFEAMLSLVNNAAAERQNPFKETTLADIYAKRQAYGSTSVLPWYCLDRNSAGTRYLRLIGPFSAAAPGDLTLMYRAAIPTYASDDASWLEDEYPALFRNCVAYHAALFAREDERIKLYEGLYEKQFNIADEDDKHNLQFGGSPLHMKPHRKVP